MQNHMLLKTVFHLFYIMNEIVFDQSKWEKLSFEEKKIQACVGFIKIHRLCF